MKLISVNVGLPREVTWKGKTVTTGIFKEPVSERVMVRALNLDGDGQADLTVLTVHGGADKAVYVIRSSITITGEVNCLTQSFPQVSLAKISRSLD